MFDLLCLRIFAYGEAWAEFCFCSFETRVVSLGADGNKLDLRIPRNRVECWDDILFQMEVWIEVGKACG